MRSKFEENGGQILNLLCMAVILVMIILQFVPYWNYDGMSTSINSYIWMPKDHGALESFLNANLAEPVNLNNEVLTPIVITLIGALLLGLQIWKLDTPIAAVGAVVIGAVGVWGYLSSGMLRLGSGWGLHIGVAAFALILGVLTLGLLFAQNKKG